VKRVVVVVVVVALAAVAWWVLRRSSDDAPVAAGGSGSAPIAVGSPHGLRGPEAPPPTWFAKAGAKARRIAGKVTLDGKPIRATVVLHSLLTRAGVSAPTTTPTDDQGSFDFGMLAAGAYTVVASAEGYVAAIAAFDSSDPTLKPPADQLELRLRACEVTMSGTIYDSSGGVIAGAHVRRQQLIGTDSNAQGRYKLCLPRGEVELEYSADGYGGVIFTLVAQGELEQNVVLVPEGIVAVTVIHATDGKPVPDALVNLFPKEWGRDRRAPGMGVTGTDGKVRIAGLTPGAYNASASTRGMISEGMVEAIVEVGSVPEITIKLVDTARITGRVLRGREPVAGATVQAGRKSPVRRSSPAISQEDGTFVLDEVPVGELVFSAHPYAVVSPAVFQAEAKAYDNVEIQVEQLGKVHGVVTRLGKPQPDAEVCCIAGLNGRRTATSDATGTYEFVGVPAGQHELVAGYFDDAFMLPTKFKLGAGETKRLDFELDQAGTIAGTVVDKAGKPVPGVFVAWLHEKTGDIGRGTTDAQGRYRCGAMTGGGTYRASVSAAPGAQRPFPTADGSPYPALVVKDGRTVIENVELRIDLQKLKIAGRVVDGNGAGIADAQVRATLTAGDQPGAFNVWQKLPSTFTDADGNFTLGDLTAGIYALQARSVDGGEGSLANITAGATGAVIKLLRPAGIEGKLVGFGATPPVVYAVPLFGGGRWISGTVDGATFRVRGLSPGRYMVSAQTTFEGDGKVVQITSGEIVQLTLTSRGRAAIEATILDFKTSAPIANAACHVVIASEGVLGVTNWDFASATKSAANGRALLDPCPAGAVTVECALSTQKWSQPSADLTVEAGGRAAVTLYGVELASENPSDPGLEFDRHRTAPVIARVTPGGNAAKAGVLPGDLVISVDGVSVAKLNASGVDILLRSHDGGDDIVLGVQRGTATKTFTFFATQ